MASNSPAKAGYYKCSHRSIDFPVSDASMVKEFDHALRNIIIERMTNGDFDAAHVINNLAQHFLHLARQGKKASYYVDRFGENVYVFKNGRWSIMQKRLQNCVNHYTKDGDKVLKQKPYLNSKLL